MIPNIQAIRAISDTMSKDIVREMMEDYRRNINTAIQKYAESGYYYAKVRICEEDANDDNITLLQDALEHLKSEYETVGYKFELDEQYIVTTEGKTVHFLRYIIVRW